MSILQRVVQLVKALQLNQRVPSSKHPNECSGRPMNPTLLYIYTYIYIYIYMYIYTSGKMFFFLKKTTTSRVCWAFKTIWSYCTLIKSNLSKHSPSPSNRTSIALNHLYYVFCICFEAQNKL